MCILPNFEPTDLEEFTRNSKRGKKKAEAETVELLVAEQPLETQI
jgi:hypothetical protein